MLKLYVSSVVVGITAPAAVQCSWRAKVREGCAAGPPATVRVVRCCIPCSEGRLTISQLSTGKQRRRVQVDAIKQMHSMIADVVYFQCCISGDFPLHGECVLLHIWVAWLVGDDD